MSELEFEVYCECQFIIGGMNFALHRERVGMSQSKVAEQLEAITGKPVNQRQISRWESSHSFKTDLMGLLAIRKVLKITTPK